jgi:hypothetical protein
MVGRDREFDPRASLAAEVERLGVDAVARRLTLAPASVERFLAGAADPRLLSALSAENLRLVDLEQFLSSYFYQGYDTETGSVTAWEPAVSMFLDLESRETIKGTVQDLRYLLDEQLSNEDLAEELWKLGSRFALKRAGYTPSTWLAVLVDRLENKLGEEW